MPESQLPTYRSAVRQETGTDFVNAPVPTYKANAAFDDVTANANQAAIKAATEGFSSIVDTVSKVALVEAKENASRVGRELAQQNFAEIEKIQVANQSNIVARDAIMTPTDYEALVKSRPNGDYSDEENSRIFQYSMLSDTIAQNDNRIKGFLEKKSQFNITEQTRADDLNEMFIQKVDIDTKATLEELYAANKRNPEVFKQKAQKLYSALDTIPEQFRESVRYNLDNSVNNVYQKAKTNAEKFQAEEISATRGKTIELKTNDITQNAFTGANVTNDIKYVADLLQKEVEAESITAVQRQNALDNLTTEVAVQKVNGGFDRVLTNRSYGPQQKINNMRRYAEDFKASMPKFTKDENGNPVPGNESAYMDQTLKDKLYDQMIRQIDSFESDLKSHNKVQGEGDSQFLTRVMSDLKAGRTVGPTDLSRARQISISNGKQNQFNMAYTTYGNVTTFRSKSPDAQGAYIARVEERIKQKEANGESTMDDYDELDTIKKMYDSTISEMKADPMGFSQKNMEGFNNGQYKPKNIDSFGTLIEYDEKGGKHFNKYIDATIGEIRDRVNHREYIEASVGNFEPFSKKEEQVLHNKYNMMSPGEKDKLIYGLQNTIGEVGTSELLKTWFKSKPAASTFAARLLATGNEFDKQVANEINQGLEYKASEKNKMPIPEQNRLKNRILQRLQVSGRGVDKASLNAIANAVEGHWYYGNSGAEESDNSSVDDSIAAVIGDEIEYNGQPIWAPARDIGEGAVENWIQQISRNDVYLLDNYSGTPKNFSMRQFKAGLKNEDFTLVSAGNGAYMLKDKQNRYVKNNNGGNYVIHYFFNNKKTGKRQPWFKTAHHAPAAPVVKPMPKGK